ncbi:MAG: thioredoxin domain-containing protein [Acidobacteriota bacterium]
MKHLATILCLAIAVCAQARRPQDKTEPDCGCEAKAPSDLLAIVNGVKIAAKDVDEPIKATLDNLRKQVISARASELYLQINSLLLEAEAKKRGMSPVKLLEQEVMSKVKEPAEAEAQEFYDKNKDRIEGEFKDVKNQVIGYLRSQRQSEAAKDFARRLREQSDVQVIDKASPQNEADRAQVVAVVGGAKITSGEIEDSLRPLIFNIQEQLYQIRKQQLDLTINNMLLEQEAQKRKITARALLEAQVKSKAKPMTEDDARKFYDENKDKIKGEFAQLKDQILSYLRDREDREAQGAFAAQLRSAAVIEVFLSPPDPPRYNIATDDQPSKGRADAMVTIVEFTDFECASCARAQPVIARLMAEYGDRVRLIVRDFPLEKHPRAFKAAEAAEAARDQGKYWQYVEVLFANQSALQIADLKQYATRVGLDREKFDAALDSGRFSDKVQRDLREGMKVGVNGTPTIFVNGRPMKENSYEALKAAVETALSRKKQLRGASALQTR